MRTTEGKDVRPQLLLVEDILTTSEAEADVAYSYAFQANCYLSKPVRLDAFENLVKSINDFWLNKASVPHQGQPA
jgi:DNA-binding NarL/FixJ family response regulator